MSYYNICPECGAHLDPGEACDCKEEQERLCKMRKRKASIYREMEREEYIDEAV